MAGDETTADDTARTKNPVRTWTVLVLVLLGVLLALQVVSDRLAPLTSKATVEGLIIPVAPRIGGEVAAVHVADNLVVDEGAALFELDPTPFQLAADVAAARLEAAGQAIGASTAEVAAAEARLAEARAVLANTRAQTERTLALVRKGTYPRARGEQAETDLAQAEADLASAEAALRGAEAALGPAGENNPQLRAAAAEFGLAQYNLAGTRIEAPTRAAISNLRVGVGSAARAGEPLATLIDLNGAWIVAYFRENQIGNIAKGDRVAIVLELRPGEVLEGHVADWGAGVMTINQDASTGELVHLPTGGWLVQPQRFPVRIEFDPPDLIVQPLRLGAQATVMVFTQDAGVLDPLWRLAMRAISWLTYVY